MNGLHDDCTTESEKAPVSLVKRISFIVVWCMISLSISLAVCEIGGRAIYYAKYGLHFPSSHFKSFLKEIASDNPANNENKQGDDYYRDYSGKQVIHPYLGYVLEPYKGMPHDLGFSGYENPLLRRSGNSVNVGIFGGSFAEDLFQFGELEKELKPLSKRPVIRCFALGGYKQPQQLFALLYILLLGAHYDIVINVDGFNEVVLPVTDNLPFHVFPMFPRGWAGRVTGIQDSVSLKQMGKLAILDEKRQTLASQMLAYNLYRSSALFLLWEAKDASVQRSRAEIAVQLERSGSKSMLYVASGPQYKFSGNSGPYQDLVRVWKSSSLLMNALCEAQGIDYYHFLQPNQYVEGTKPMSMAEKRRACDMENEYRVPVVKGYPILRKEGKHLKEMGVRFHDLTELFTHNEEILYSDTCCHLNHKGYRITARTIAERILRDQLKGRSK